MVELGLAPMTVVALSASYGAGGGFIGPALAERLDVRFLDRAIPMAVAADLDLPFDEVDAHDEARELKWHDRLLTSLLGGYFSGIAPEADEKIVIPADFRHATDRVIRRLASHGSGVILGRAAVIVLRQLPGVLCVRLDGPPARRLRQAMRLQRIDEATAGRAMRRFDRAQRTYFGHYGAQPDDAALYHLVIDSTALPLDACVELIAGATTAIAPT